MPRWRGRAKTYEPLFEKVVLEVVLRDLQQMKGFAVRSAIARGECADNGEHFNKRQQTTDYSPRELSTSLYTRYACSITGECAGGSLWKGLDP